MAFMNVSWSEEPEYIGSSVVISTKRWFSQFYSTLPFIHDIICACCTQVRTFWECFSPWIEALNKARWWSEGDAILQWDYEGASCFRRGVSVLLRKTTSFWPLPMASVWNVAIIKWLTEHFWRNFGPFIPWFDVFISRIEMHNRGKSYQ